MNPELFKFECPSCGQHISASMNDAGVNFDCPTCGKPLVAPSPPPQARQDLRNLPALVQPDNIARNFSIVVILLLVAGISWFLWYESALLPFTSHQGEYDLIINTAFATDPPSNKYNPALSDAPLIQGKLLPLDVDHGIMISFLKELPPTLRPRTHEEIGTLVTYEDYSAEAGRYGYGVHAYETAYRRLAILTFIDVTTKSVIGRYTIIGGPPPETTKLGDGYGPYPRPEARAFLRSVKSKGEAARR